MIISRKPYKAFTKEFKLEAARLMSESNKPAADLSPHSQARLSEVATQLNERPRKTLKFKTPSHMIE
jgi:IS30 family transposase